MGRPTMYSEELANLICETISTSNVGLAHICKNNESFPTRTTIYEWIKINKSFADKYARAKEDQADFLAEEIVTIADAPLMTRTEFIGGGNSSGTISDNVQRSKLMVEARKWVASKLKPKTWGEKIQTEHSGDVGINYEDFIKQINNA